MEGMRDTRGEGIEDDACGGELGVAQRRTGQHRYCGPHQYGATPCLLFKQRRGRPLQTTKLGCHGWC